MSLERTSPSGAPVRSEHPPSRRRVGVALALTLVAALLAVAPTVGAGAAASSFLGTKPYLRLFTQAGDCMQIINANNLMGSALTAKLDELTSYYVHFHSEGSNNFQLGKDCQGSSPTTFASKLAGRGAWVSNYRNGSFVSQANLGQINFGEAADIETKAPLRDRHILARQLHPQPSRERQFHRRPADGGPDRERHHGEGLFGGIERSPVREFLHLAVHQFEGFRPERERTFEEHGRLRLVDQGGQRADADHIESRHQRHRRGSDRPSRALGDRGDITLRE